MSTPWMIRPKKSCVQETLTLDLSNDAERSTDTKKNLTNFVVAGPPRIPQDPQDFPLQTPSLTTKSLSKTVGFCNLRKRDPNFLIFFQNILLWKIVWSQANIRNTLFNQTSPRHPEVGVLRLHRHTHKQTDMATLWLTRPREPSHWKILIKIQVIWNYTKVKKISWDSTTHLTLEVLLGGDVVDEVSLCRMANISYLWPTKNSRRRPLPSTIFVDAFFT